MRGQSHLYLGNYLIEHYMLNISKFHARAFLTGCIQPDKNPLTYLKGSVNHQWMRGHNYKNAQRFMRKISSRLESRTVFRLYDYYTLGKLIHYAADAFTFAHNESFGAGLSAHRQYEISHQFSFLNYIQQNPRVHIQVSGSIMDTVGQYHWEYSRVPSYILRDCYYILNVCCCIIAILELNRRI